MNGLHIGMTVSRVDQKMEYGAVMPNVVAVNGHLGLKDAGFKPANIVGLCAQAFFRNRQRLQSAAVTARHAVEKPHPYPVEKCPMAYTEKFPHLADEARSRVVEVRPQDVDGLMTTGAIALDIRDKDEHDLDHIPGSLHVSRGKLEMMIEGVVPDFDTTILCYCNANNRGALSANTLRTMGYHDVRFIAGGLKAYRALV